MPVTNLSLDLIRTDGGTQPRAAISEDMIAAYVEDMTHGAEFPPLIVFHDGAEYWLADGFHRYFAAKGCELDAFGCDVRTGTRRDAILFSVSANAAHGLRRSNADKRKAVLTLLNDEQWAQWSDSEVARQCGVSHPFVAKVRADLTPAHLETFQDSPRTVQRGGSTYEMNTALIGRKADPDAAVFDATPAGEGVASERKPTLSEQAAPTPIDRMRDDMAENGWLFSELKEALERVEALPDGPDVARRMPRSLRHSFNTPRLRAAAEQLSRIADAWAQENGDDYAQSAQ